MSNHTRIRCCRVVIPLFAIIAATASGCSQDKPATAPQPPVTSAATAAEDGPPIPLLSPGELNAGFMLALDPTTAPAVRRGAVEGADTDPQLPDRLTQATRENDVTITVTGVEYVGDGVANASADMVVKGKPVEGKVTIPFVARDGRWKLQRAWACQQLLNADIQSPACTG